MTGTRIDRLSALIGRFGIKAEIVPYSAAAELEFARAPNLFAARRGLQETLPDLLPEAGSRIVYFPQQTPADAWIALQRQAGPELLMARVDIGGGFNPMAEALPGSIVPAGGDAAFDGVIDILLDEHEEPRCGGFPLLGRMIEILVIRLLRQEIARGAAEIGMLGGLAHSGLAAAMVAMHEEPQRDWMLEDLAVLAGMSRTHFANSFRSIVGVTPMVYLASWRLTLARMEIGRGVPIKSVARRVGYGSAAALSRAYSRRYGFSPRDEKHLLAAE